MAKKGVDIKIEANTKSAAQGIDKITEQLNKFAKESNSSLSKFSKLGSAVSGVQASFSMVTGAMKAAKEAVMDLVDATSIQQKAEIQLETAARNNPYMANGAVERLKDYASQLQSISAVGDETLIPLMAQLVSAGRSEAEAMEIMSAALDASASGAISLESAVTSLSKSYSGEAGELSKLNPKVKELTQEQLKGGEAVKLIASSYKGMAENVKKQVGGIDALKGAWGDFKEELGKPLNAILNPLANAFADALGGISKTIDGLYEKIKKIKKFLQGDDGLNPDTIVVDYNVTGADIKETEEKIKRLEAATAELNKTKKEGGQVSVETGKVINEENAEIQKYQKNIDKYNAALKIQQEIESAANEVKNKGIDISKKSIKEIIGLANDIDKAAGETETSGKKIADAMKGAEGYFSQSDYKKLLSQNLGYVSGYFNDLKTLADNCQKEIDEQGARVATNGGAAIANNLDRQLAYERELLKKQQDKLAQQEKDSADARAKERQDALNAELDKIKESGEKNLKAIEDNKNKQEALIAAGMQETFDDSAYLSAIVNAYSAMLSDASAMTFDASKAKAQEFIQQILAKYKDAVGKVVKELDDFTEDDFDPWASLKTEISAVLDDTGSSVDEQIALLEKLRDEWELIPDAVKLVDNALKNLKDSSDKLKENPMKEWLESDNGQFVTNLNEVVGKFGEAVNAAADNQLTQIENIKDAELSSLEAQKDQGIITEEEYQEKKKEIEKKAAKEEYKYKLAQWASNVAVTTGQVAMAVVQALASMSPPLSYAMAAATAALGAAQLAAVIGSKPVPPSYATGGVVGGYSGASLGGDNTYIHARSGEMMLNAAQQRNLYDFANTRSGGNSGLKVSIQNYMGDSAEASASLDEDTLNIIIDRRVTGQLANGSYGAALTKSNVKSRGTVITS